jgi:hypothetical protein
MDFSFNKIIPLKHRCSKWNQILTPSTEHSALAPWYDFEFADDYYTQQLRRRSTSCQLCLQSDASINYPKIVFVWKYGDHFTQYFCVQTPITK